MRLMGIEALGPKPNTSKPAPGHKIYPYLLRNLSIERANQVWATDITYIPLGQAFSISWRSWTGLSRAVLSWRLSNTMDVSFCVEALEEALAAFRHAGYLQQRSGKPVHERRPSPGRLRCRSPNLDGRSWTLHGQHLHRAAVALAEARGHLPEALRRWPRSARRHPKMDRVLQRPPSRTRRSATKRQCVCGAKTSACGEEAVDMDNASTSLDNTSPRCPHAHSRNRSSAYE